jgi:hypothetical protein
MTRSARLWGWCTAAAMLALSGCGGSSAPPTATVTISPHQAAVAATTQTQQFSATVTGTVSDLTVAWNVDGMASGDATVGTISSTGLYTPPATGGTHTITAASVALPTSSASATVAVTDLPGVFTYHNDLSRDGANTQEYALTSSTVTVSTFGKLFSCPADGAVYTQPLWVPGVNINGTVHNVIYVATQHDSVFAFDADANPCVQLWQAKLLDTLHGGTANEWPVPWNDVGNCLGDIYPEVGVTGTPVIDPTTNTIYVVSASDSNPTSSGNCSGSIATFYHRLHALDITNGSERFNGPVTIAAQVVGTGDGSSGGLVSFNSQLEHNRSGLALSGDGTVYVAFAAHEDATPYHGWLFGYTASDLSQTPSVFNTTPNGADGGIWGGGGAPAVDSGNDVYVATGNGLFDEGSGFSMENDYGDSVLRLSALSGSTPNGANLQLDGWFTAGDQLSDAEYDADLGSGAPVLLPDQTVGPPHLLVQLGKDGFVYLIDRDSMGQYQSSDNQIQQSFQVVGGFWGTPAFWQNNLYFAGAYAGATDNLKQVSFNATTGLFNTVPLLPYSGELFGFPGVSPSVSSQGAENGIVWAVDAGLYGYASPNAPLVNGQPFNCYVSPVPAPCTGPAVLHAYSASNLASEYWNSALATGNRDQAGNAVKFVPPTIANGKVYVSTRTEVDVYGLLPGQ